MKVKALYPENGYESDNKQFVKYLKVGQEYEVERKVVGNWHTDIYLKEFLGVAFNSVQFKEVKGK